MAIKQEPVNRRTLENRLQVVKQEPVTRQTRLQFIKQEPLWEVKPEPVYHVEDNEEEWHTQNWYTYSVCSHSTRETNTTPRRKSKLFPRARQVIELDDSSSEEEHSNRGSMWCGVLTAQINLNHLKTSVTTKMIVACKQKLQQQGI